MTAKSNRAPWLVAAIAGCLAVCFCVAFAGASAYVFFGASPLSTLQSVAATPTAFQNAEATPTAFQNVEATPTVLQTIAATPTARPNVATTPTARATKSVIDIPKDKATCEAQGGRWGRIGLSPVESCNLPTSDAGTVCSDSSECESLCIADLSQADRDRLMRNRVTIETNGKCAPWRITVGCIPRVTEGQVTGLLCID